MSTSGCIRFAGQHHRHGCVSSPGQSPLYPTAHQGSTKRWTRGPSRAGLCLFFYQIDPSKYLGELANSLTEYLLLLQGGSAHQQRTEVVPQRAVESTRAWLRRPHQAQEMPRLQPGPCLQPLPGSQLERGSQDCEGTKLH